MAKGGYSSFYRKESGSFQSFQNARKGKFIGFKIKTAVVAHADFRYL